MPKHYPMFAPTDTELPQPAIKVTVSRQVTLSFAPIVGVTNPRTVSATAIAILPEKYGITGLPPLAVAWDVVYNNVGGTTVVDATEQDIKIQSNKGLAGWFNLDGGNSVPSVRIDAPQTAKPADFGRRKPDLYGAGYESYLDGLYHPRLDLSCAGSPKQFRTKNRLSYHRVGGVYKSIR